MNRFGTNDPGAPRMKILIVYGTTEGHTRQLCDFAAVALNEAGHDVTTIDAGRRADPQPSSYDAAILAASIHVGRYQAPLAAYARGHRTQLAEMPNAFVSVSLSAAGENPDDWAGLEQCVARFEQETDWTPQVVHHAAGAIRYSHYDFFKRLLLKYIAHKRGKGTVTSRDYDLTDYDALRSFVLDFATTAAEAPKAAQPA